MIGGAAQLFGGRLAAQLISIVTMPLVTRLYSPADFGVFAVLISTIAVLAPLSTLRYDEVIFLPKDEDEALNVYSLSILISQLVAVMVFVSILLFLSSPLALSFGKLDMYRRYIWVIPVAVSFRGILHSSNSMALRMARFKNIAIANVTMTGSNRSVVLAIGFLSNTGPWGLIIGRLFGLAAAVVYIHTTFLAKHFRLASKIVSKRKILSLAKRYSQFPLYGTWSELLHIAAKEMVVFLLATLFSSAVAGHYSLAFNMVYVPTTLLSYSVAQVFLQRASALRHERVRLSEETRKIVAFLVYSSLPPLLVLLVLGDWLFTLVFGSDWLESGKYVQALCPAFFCAFIYNPMRSLFIALEKPKARLLFDIVYFASRAAVLIAVALLTGSALTAILSMSLATFALLMVFLVFIGGPLETGRLAFPLAVAGKFIIMIPFLCALILVRAYLLPFPLPAIAAISLLFILQLALIAHREPQVVEDLKTALREKSHMEE